MSEAIKPKIEDLKLLNGPDERGCARVKVLACKDPDGSIRQFVCVPTQITTIPAAYIPGLMSNPLTRLMIESMQKV